MSKECILPVVSFPSRASGSNDRVERSILLKGLSKAKPHFDILRFDIRYSAVRCSIISSLCAMPYALCVRYYLEFYLQMVIILCLAINLIWRQVHADFRVPL